MRPGMMMGDKTLFITSIPEDCTLVAENGIGGVRELHPGSPIRRTDKLFVFVMPKTSRIDIAVYVDGLEL